MEVLIEKKMIDEPVMIQLDHHGKPRAPPTELEPCEEFPILYGLLTAPKSFKPKNSEELQFLPHELSGGVNGVVMGRVQLLNSRPVVDSDIISMEEADSQNLDFCREDSGASSRSSSCSPQMVDSSSNLSTADENDSPIFLNYLSERRNRNSRSGNRGDSMSDDESSMVSSPGGSSAGGDECLDDNIPTSTTSGFKRKASRLETAIGNIVRRRRVQKRVSPNSSSNYNNNNSSMLSVPISMAPSSPTVSTTCVDPPAPSSALSQQNSSRGRSEILERILRSSTTNTVNNPAASQQQQLQPSGRDNVPRNEGRRHNDSNNNNDSSYEPYAKLRDLLTMSEDQLVKRRRIEYGLPNSNNKTGGGEHDTGRGGREYSPPRNNILASLLQKGRQFDPPRGGRYPLENNAVIRNNNSSPGIVSINLNLSDSNDSSSNGNDERPYKCSLCDLRFKKLPLLNRHVKTHSHIKRYVCRFCSHAFKRSDNLLAHMRTSCKGIKEADAKFAGGVRQPASGTQQGQIIPSLLSPSSSPSLNNGSAAPSSHSVSRSQLEEALLSLRGQNDKIYNSNQNSNSLVSTTTASPPPRVVRRQIIQPGPDFQSRHSKLLEILSGSPVIPNSNLEDEMPLPLSLKVERCSASSPSSLSPSSSQSQLLRSHQRTLYYNNLVKQNELPDEDSQTEEEEEEVHESEQPLDLGSSRVLPPVQPITTPPTVPSVRSRDHPEIVSILSRQPKNVVMMAPDLRKFVGIDSL
ncbi:DNA-binding protein creA [Orchesella cincta]|uniref:DNA-binding protein creA n=1 Tax=Orchesella cincta TaxID=48709 RepID=A0A1D2N565_ORCCI|nr:DNA-binding protein creA [Orchesella cincta]